MSSSSNAVGIVSQDCFFAQCTWPPDLAPLGRGAPMGHRWGDGTGIPLKGKGYEEPKELTFEEQIVRGLAEAAKPRMQAALLQKDWEQQVAPWQQRGPKRGAATVPNDSLPEVLRNAGYTAKPTAAVLTQNPNELGLRADPRSHV